jgi:DeoD family purine-nucleoside phosphorylase
MTLGSELVASSRSIPRGNSARDENHAVTSRSLESWAVAGQTTFHLRPTAELAERVLLPGDPGRALALAQALLHKPLMFNHHRGLWGYTGTAADGEPLSIQSTGMGGPSAAIVLHELIALGAKRAIRVGTCGALDGELDLGDLLIADEAIAADGTSRLLSGSERLAADAALLRALQSAAANGAERSETASLRVGTVVSTDLFYEPDDTRERGWRAAGAVAVEMESATLFSLGARAAIQVACVLAVSDTFDGSGERQRIQDEHLLGAAERMGRLAADALSLQ